MTRAERRHRAKRVEARSLFIWHHIWKRTDSIRESRKQTFRDCSCVLCKRYSREKIPDRGPQIEEEW